MIDQLFTDRERRRLLWLAIRAVPQSEPPDPELLHIIRMLSGVDTVVIARRAWKTSD